MDKHELKTIIVERLNLKITPDSIEDGASLKEDINLSSIDALELVTALEDEYDVEIDDDIIFSILESVNTMYDFLTRVKGA